VIEHAITSRVLAEALAPNGRVLDLGGGPGRYAIGLAERGHRVTLADLSPELLARAREHVALANVSNVEEIVEVDACDLSRWQDASFDAVVCLGPFYHLPDRGRRKHAALELVRVLRPGGIAVIACMPVWTFVRRTLAIADEQHHLLDATFMSQLLDHGDFANDVPGRFTGGFGVRPEEIAPYFRGFGLSPIRLLAAEGISTGIESEIVSLAKTNPPLFARALDLLYETASEPSALGMCNHLLFVARKG
jgi:SAM-dependent methyltransferase